MRNQCFNRPVSIGSPGSTLPGVTAASVEGVSASSSVAGVSSPSCELQALASVSPEALESALLSLSPEAPPTGGLAKPGSSPPPWQPKGLHPASTWSLRPLQRNKTKYSAGGHRSNSSTDPPRHTSSLRFSGSLLSWFLSVLAQPTFGQLFSGPVS